MAKYAELKQKFTNERSGFLTYWAELAEEADRRLRSFARYLGIDPASTVDLVEGEVAALRIGKMSANEFVPCSSRDLDRDDNELIVVFELNFSLETSPPGVKRIYFHLRLTSKSGQFEALVPKDSGHKVFVNGEVGFFELLIQQADQ